LSPPAQRGRIAPGSLRNGKAASDFDKAYQRKKREKREKGPCTTGTPSHSSRHLGKKKRKGTGTSRLAALKKKKKGGERGLVPAGMEGRRGRRHPLTPSPRKKKGKRRGTVPADPDSAAQKRETPSSNRPVPGRMQRGVLCRTSLSCKGRRALNRGGKKKKGVALLPSS